MKALKINTLAVILMAGMTTAQAAPRGAEGPPGIAGGPPGINIPGLVSGHWIPPTIERAGVMIAPHKLCAARCGKGAGAKAPRTKYFMAKATSNYRADLHNPSATTLDEEMKHRLSCTISIMNYSRITQHVRWEARFMVARPNKTKPMPEAKSTMVNAGRVYNFYDGVSGRVLANDIRTLNPQGPEGGDWLRLASGEVLELVLLNDHLVTGYPAAFMPTNPNGTASDGVKATQYCTGYVQVCDPLTPEENIPGSIMVGGDMEYIADSPDNFKQRWATALRDGKSPERDTVATSAPNCFRDRAKDQGALSMMAGTYNARTCKDGTGPGGPPNPNDCQTVGRTTGDGIFTRREKDMDIGGGSGDNFLRWDLNNPTYGYNASYLLSDKSAARFYAMLTNKGTGVAAQASYAACMDIMKKSGAELYALWSGVQLKDMCESQTDFDSALARMGNPDINDDIIEDVGQRRSYSAGSAAMGGLGTGNRCFSYNKDTAKDSNDVTYNEPLETGQFPQHIGVVPVTVNGGDTL